MQRQATIRSSRPWGLLGMFDLSNRSAFRALGFHSLNGFGRGCISCNFEATGLKTGHSVAFPLFAERLIVFRPMQDAFMAAFANNPLSMVSCHFIILSFCRGIY